MFFGPGCVFFLSNQACCGIVFQSGNATRLRCKTGVFVNRSQSCSRLSVFFPGLRRISVARQGFPIFCRLVCFLWPVECVERAAWRWSCPCSASLPDFIEVFPLCRRCIPQPSGNDTLRIRMMDLSCKGSRAWGTRLWASFTRLLSHLDLRRLNFSRKTTIRFSIAYNCSVFVRWFAG